MEGSRFAGIQDRCIQSLCHPSGCRWALYVRLSMNQFTEILETILLTCDPLPSARFSKPLGRISVLFASASIQIPAHLCQGPSATFEFCKSIIDATAEGVCAFKPQIAWFSAARHEQVLSDLIAHIHEHAPQTPVILDAKRGNKGETNRAYTQEAFGRHKKVWTRPR